MLSDKKIKMLKTIKKNEFDEKFICDFFEKWNDARKVVQQKMDALESLYQTNKDFKAYVDRYMRNKDVTLRQVLSYKQTQLVAEMYEKESQ